MLYRNTDERFGDTTVTFELDEILCEIEPVLRKWAAERIETGEYDGTIDQSFSDLVDEFTNQCEIVND